MQEEFKDGEQAELKHVEEEEEKEKEEEYEDYEEAGYHQPSLILELVIQAAVQGPSLQGTPLKFF